MITPTLERFERDAFATLNDILFGCTVSSGCGEHMIERKNGRVEMSASFAVLLLKRYQRDCSLSRPNLCGGGK